MHMLEFLFFVFKFFLRRGARNYSQLHTWGVFQLWGYSKAKTQEDCIRAVMNGPDTSYKNEIEFPRTL